MTFQNNAVRVKNQCGADFSTETDANRREMGIDVGLGG